MKDRPTRLQYVGAPYFAYGVPARDLEAEDIALLTDDELAHITGPMPATGKPLYAAHGAKPAASAPAPVKPADAKPETGKEG